MWAPLPRCRSTASTFARTYNGDVWALLLSDQWKAHQPNTRLRILAPRPREPPRVDWPNVTRWAFAPSRIGITRALSALASRGAGPCSMRLTATSDSSATTKGNHAIASDRKSTRLNSSHLG